MSSPADRAISAIKAEADALDERRRQQIDNQKETIDFLVSKVLRARYKLEAGLKADPDNTIMQEARAALIAVKETTPDAGS